MTEIVDIDKYKYFGFGIGSHVFLYLMVVGFGKNAIICGANMSSSVMLIIEKKLILGKGPMQSLSDTTVTAGKEYSTNFTEQHKKFCLSLYHNRVNSYFFVNNVKTCKAKELQIKAAPLCLGNVSKVFSVDNMKDTGLYVYDFLVTYDGFYFPNIFEVHEKLITKHDIK